MANKNDNKSMFLYTALIFIVAVLLIIFSFLGQTNMQKNQPQVSEPCFSLKFYSPQQCSSLKLQEDVTLQLYLPELYTDK